ncbi:MAG: hypothetical protein WA736_11835 [Candidatus Acidiferrum sp.]
MNAIISRVDHTQVAAPEGCEHAAREFYGLLLGLHEIEKPASLRARGRCWFQCGDQQLHIGVEAAFQPAKKAASRLRCCKSRQTPRISPAHGVNITDDDSLPGARRFYAEDPWGNRLEFLQLTS